jgi:predicted metal-dependent phosphoesterase TrpH
MSSNRGSEWRRWDLHCHTPLDHEWINKPTLNTNSEKQAFAKEYIDFAIKQDLSVIAITDHNFCSSIDDLLIT